MEHRVGAQRREQETLLAQLGQDRIARVPATVVVQVDGGLEVRRSKLLEDGRRASSHPGGGGPHVPDPVEILLVVEVTVCVQPVLDRGADVADQHPQVERETIPAPQELHHRLEARGLVAVHEACDQASLGRSRGTGGRDPDQRRLVRQRDEDVPVRSLQERLEVLVTVEAVVQPSHGSPSYRLPAPPETRLFSGRRARCGRAYWRTTAAGRAGPAAGWHPPG
jgi:hypothetical protein